MPIRVSKIIEYATIIGLIFGSVEWINSTIATKTDLLVAVNSIERGMIDANKSYYERIGIDNLSEEDKERFEVLKNEEKANEIQYKRLLGLD